MNKQPQLSIVLRTVDKATAGIRALNARVDAATRPIRDFKSALSDLKSKSGLDDVIGGFRGVGSAIAGVLSKVGMIAGVAGVAVAGLFKLVDGFDELGDKAEEMGVSVDFLAQMRFAAEKSGAAVEQLDSGLKGFSTSLGMARAGTGKMAGFLKLVSPALLKQLKAAKGNEAAFDLLAKAMDKIEDPAKRAAFAQKTLGDASLAPLLNRGSKGIKELRDQYFALAGSQEGAVTEAGKVDDSMKDLKAATDGVKAALVTGLAPALKVIVDRLREWFTTHRADIAEWAKNIGERLPGAIKAVVEWLGVAWEKVKSFVDMIGGLRNAAIGVGLVIAGPLIGSIVSLGGALLTVISRLGAMTGAFGTAAKAGGAAGGVLSKLGFLGPAGLAVGAAGLLNEATGGSIGEGQGGAMGVARKMLEAQQAARQKRWDEWRQQTGFTRPTVDTSLALPQSRVPIASSTNETKITVDFANAPKGTRVKTDPQSTADVDLSVGYQMAGAM